MDEEFGVSNLVDATFKQEKEKVGVRRDLAPSGKEGGSREKGMVGRGMV